VNNTTAIIGFDSAWADNAPGAICALVVSPGGIVDFKPPKLVHFDEALAFIEKEGGRYDLCLIAVDQPTIVPNMIGCRPVDRVAASVISFIGGGVQPANRSRQGLFDDDAPFWRFKSRVNAKEDPEQSRSAESGRFIIEVFPALALATFNVAFFGRLRGPKYNPANKRKFRPDDWIAVVATVGRHAQLAGIIEIEAWAKETKSISSFRKADQDRLDAVLCALVGYQWRMKTRENSIMVGDLTSGYMIAPTNLATRERLQKAAAKHNVACA
jgi:predicted RNase H-like nuclease